MLFSYIAISFLPIDLVTIAYVIKLHTKMTAGSLHKLLIKSSFFRPPTDADFAMEWFACNSVQINSGLHTIQCNSIQTS